MYDIVPDLLKAYYVSISVALLIGGFIGFGICYSWMHRHAGPGFTSGAGYDAYGYEEDEPITDHDAPVWYALYQASKTERGSASE